MASSAQSSALAAAVRPWMARLYTLGIRWRSMFSRGGQPHAKRTALHLDATPLEDTPVAKFKRKLFRRNPGSGLKTEEQIALREALEVLALAMYVDAPMLSKLAFEGETYPTERSWNAFRAGEKLRVQVNAKVSPNTKPGGDFYGGFFQSWSEESASEEFKETKRVLKGF